MTEEQDPFSVGAAKQDETPKLPCEACNNPTELGEMAGWAIPYDNDAGQHGEKFILVCMTCNEVQEQMNDDEVVTEFNKRLEGKK